MALPSPALLIQDLPQGTSCTLNLLSFTTTPTFAGFKNLSPGAHIFTFSPSAAGLAARHGIWLHITSSLSSDQPSLLVYRYDRTNESLLPVSGADALGARANLGSIWTRLVDYAAVAQDDDWPRLSSHITPSYLAKVFPAAYEVDTFSESASTDPAGLALAKLPSQRSFAPGVVGRERTLAATDGSWHLSSILATLGGEDVFLAEMQFSFLAALMVTNIVCLEHWRALLSAALTCTALVAQRPSFFASVLRQVAQQLSRVVDEDSPDPDPAPKQNPQLKLEDASEAELLAYDLPLRNNPAGKKITDVDALAADELPPQAPGASELARLFLDADAGVTRPDGTASSFLHPLVGRFRSALDGQDASPVLRALAELEGRLFTFFGWTFDDDDDDDEDGDEDGPAVVQLTQAQLDALGFEGVVVQERSQAVQAGLTALREGGVSRVVVEDSESEDDNEEEAVVGEDDEEEWDTTQLEDLDERY